MSENELHLGKKGLKDALKTGEPVLDTLVQRVFKRHTRIGSYLDGKGIRQPYLSLNAVEDEIQQVTEEGITLHDLFLAITAQTKIVPSEIMGTSSESLYNKKTWEQFQLQVCVDILDEELATRFPKINELDNKRMNRRLKRDDSEFWETP